MPLRSPKLIAHRNWKMLFRIHVYLNTIFETLKVHVYTVQNIYYIHSNIFYLLLGVPPFFLRTLVCVGGFIAGGISKNLQNMMYDIVFHFQNISLSHYL